MKLNYIKNCDNLVGLRGLPGDCIDLTVTSPPYDNLRTYKGFSWDVGGLIAEIYRVTKPGGVVVWVVNDATVNGSETGSSFRQALAFMAAGFNLHDTMIWEKPTFTATGSLAVRYAPVFEYMFVFSKGRPKTFNPIKDKPNIYGGKKHGGTVRQADGSMKPKSGAGGKIVADFGQRHNVWRIDTCKAKKDRNGHPAPFPEILAHDHIISWSNPGDVVLDPFMGSGTTAAACIKTGRKYVGFEISAEYCAIAEERIAAIYDEGAET